MTRAEQIAEHTERIHAGLTLDEVHLLTSKEISVTLAVLVDEIVKIREVLTAALPPADTRPLPERVSEITEALASGMSAQQREWLGL